VEVVRDIGSFDAPSEGLAVTIGAYDGLHVGHRRLISELRARARSSGLPTAVVTFDRHPASIVRPESAPMLLTDVAHKMELLSETGVDYAVLVTFDAQRAEERAEDFVTDFLVSALRTRLVVVGANFHFGRDREGSVELLQKMSGALGLEVVGVGLTSTDDGEIVSSSRIRRLLAGGRVAEAARLLGRPHEVRGIVEHGDSTGGPVLGCPTANVAAPAGIMLPGNGIYAGWYKRGSGSVHRCAISLGVRPTFTSRPAELVLEAHLIDFEGDLYGEKAQVAFGERTRDEERFSSPEELSRRIQADVAAVRSMLVDASPPWAC
jgi:riboflavin kinase/FMN adenylyltransferase